MKLNLFTYWEGKKPSYIEMCQENIRNKTQDTFNYISLTETTLFDYVPRTEFPDNFFRLIPAHKADYARCVMLLRLGGVWLDCDQILLSNLSEIPHLLENFDYVGYEWEAFFPSLGFMAVKKDCLLLNDWKVAMDQLLQDRFVFGWEELGYHILVPLLKKMKGNGQLTYWAYPAQQTFAPLHWSDHRIFFSKEAQMDIHGLYSVMLYNSQFPTWFKDMSKEEILQGDYLISRLFRRCF